MGWCALTAGLDPVEDAAAVQELGFLGQDWVASYFGQVVVYF
jgi:hypothetical protein